MLNSRRSELRPSPWTARRTTRMARQRRLSFSSSLLSMRTSKRTTIILRRSELRTTRPLAERRLPLPLRLIENEWNHLMTLLLNTLEDLMLSQLSSLKVASLLRVWLVSYDGIGVLLLDRLAKVKAQWAKLHTTSLTSRKTLRASWMGWGDHILWHLMKENKWMDWHATVETSSRSYLRTASLFHSDSHVPHNSNHSAATWIQPGFLKVVCWAHDQVFQSIVHHLSVIIVLCFLLKNVFYTSLISLIGLEVIDFAAFLPIRLNALAPISLFRQCDILNIIPPFQKSLIDREPLVSFSFKFSHIS